ncbi:hypothetical protein Nizo2802_1101 [Lactiplantibacillus plantarum]|nr:hypothetical protein Nizo2802_1101 [Lactiplantibacillus plantarum]
MTVASITYKNAAIADYVYLIGIVKSYYDYQSIARLLDN